ncbi:MAG: hypothetical protein K2I22_05760 [Lachnospiraceae bacterium]|nr:hypothetical protein [Lachnospiraceae bacterium]
MSDKNNDGKTIVFNPSGFILKLIFSIGMTVMVILYNINSASENSNVFKLIFLGICTFVIFWFIASMFGFSLRATGNYIIAVILLVILVVAFSAGLTWVSSKGGLAGNIAGIVFILFMIWLPVNDVRKAILYFKNTV